MAIVDLSKQTSVDTSFDGVVIQKMIEDIPGGRSLDVSGVDAAYGDVLKAGHVIIREKTTKEYAAQAVNSSNVYQPLSGGYSNYEYAGVLYVSVAIDKPLASIMVRGTMNTKAATESGLPANLPAAEAALTLIRFVEA